MVFLLAGLLFSPLPAGGTDLSQGFILPGGQSQGNNFNLWGVAGLPGAGLSAAGHYTLRSGLVFPCRGVALSATSISISEGGAAASYDLRLLTEPAYDVVITVSGDPQLQVNPVSLTFTAANWSIPQSVTVSAIDDWLSQGTRDATISHSAASSDSAYDSIIIGGVTFHIADDDNPGVNITESDGSTTMAEGDSDSYTLVLNSQPASGVSLSVYAPADIILNPDNLTFTPLNWSVPQAVNVSAPDDAIPQGSRDIEVNHISASIDLQYDALAIPPVIAHVLDNDSPGVNIIQSGGSTEVTEGGEADSYQVNLSTMPAENVTVSVYASGAALQLSVSSLTFTPANWNSLQTVEVTVPDDILVEGDRTGNISHTVASADPDYNGIAVIGIDVTIHDNDIPGFLVTETGGNTVVTEGGGGDSYTLALKTQPANDVTIFLSGSGEISVSPAILVFTSADWDQPQTITVNAVDDSVLEGDHYADISYVVQSIDTDYQSLTLSPLQVSIVDNDLPSGNNHGTHSNSSNDTKKNIPPVPVNSTTGSADIAPEAGGSISLHNLAVITIPGGALAESSNTPVEIRQINSSPAIPRGYRLLGNTYGFNVGGAEHYHFNKPVQITFFFDPSALSPGERPGIFYYDDTRGDWVNLGGEISGNSVTIMVDHFSIFALMVTKTPPETPVTSKTLKDIQGHWAQKAIEKLLARGVINGYPDGSFKPEARITRAEFITMLVKALNLKTSGSGSSFNDTSRHWAKDSIAAASSLEIVGGYGDGSFKPDQPITREQMAVITVKAAGLAPVSGEPAFADSIKISAWAKAYVLAAHHADIISGHPGNLFLPQDGATRAEAATVIINILN